MTRTPTTPYRRSAAPGRTHDFFGHLVTYLAEATDTDGTLTVLEVSVRQGGEPPRHVHTLEDEAFYVLDGTFTFTAGDDELQAGPGGFVWLPRGVPHTFTVDRDGARALVLATPAGLERTFRAFSRPVQSLVLPPVPADPPFAEMLALDMTYGVQYPDLASQ